ncbi:hypothetical protein BHM03_00017502 [Ensete ventricosum]|nr:hypothetical protein BHM03_00017502 [Ensete ventricosum]
MIILLKMEERMTLCNMVVEAGGKNGVVPADETTFKYLEDKTSKNFEPVYSDDNARFIQEYRIDVSKLEPLVAKMPSSVALHLRRPRRSTFASVVFSSLGDCVKADVDAKRRKGRSITMSTGKARTGRYIPVRQLTGTRTTRYRAIPPKSIADQVMKLCASTNVYYGHQYLRLDFRARVALPSGTVLGSTYRFAS